MAAAGSLLAACAGPEATEEAEPTLEPTVAEEAEPTLEPTVAEEVEAPTAVPSKYQESPMLTERVNAGELPPVDERLPKEPLVIEPWDEIGEYGGTLTMGSERTQMFKGDPDYSPGISQQYLRFTPDMQGVIPNFAKAYEVSDDGTTFTIYLREGAKWSDGEPLTADDVIFWYEDVFMNDDLYPVKSPYLSPGGEPVVVEKVDDYTVTWTFAQPFAAFTLAGMAHQYGFDMYMGHSIWPAHYLKQFHIKYNDQANELAQEAGQEEWYQNFLVKADHRENVDVPIWNRPFVAVEETTDGTSYERNPFFFAVDPEGNQLPYLDGMYTERVTDIELLNTRTIAGEYDYAGFSVNIQNYSTYADNAEQGDYRIVLWKNGKGADVIYNFNLTYPDEVMREVFRDVRFRRAMSLAINRQEMNDVIYFGRAEPRQFSLIPESKWFRKEHEEAYAEYDPEQANALLDEMGLEWDDAEQWRLFPDGRPLRIEFDMWASGETPKQPNLELVREYWNAVGVDIQWNEMTRKLLTPKIQANEEPMSIWHGDKSTHILLAVGSLYFVPITGDESTWGILWAKWHETDGEEGEEPPQEIKDLWEWQSKLRATLEQEWADKICSSQAENLWTLGTVGNAPQPLILRNNLRNVAEDGIFVWDNKRQYAWFPEAWYFKS
jgi:peptide/nickel transport system substrate-binding protein